MASSSRPTEWSVTGESDFGDMKEVAHCPGSYVVSDEVLSVKNRMTHTDLSDLSDLHLLEGEGYSLRLPKIDEFVASCGFGNSDPESRNSFQRVAITSSVEEFNVIVNGVLLDSQLSKHIKTKYHELCYSQGTLIHEHLPEGRNYKLVVGMISEIVNIANAIRASKITTSLDCFVKWYKTLKGLKVLGMEVSFLLTRLEHLIGLATKASTNTARYSEVKIKQDQTQEGKKVLERKLEEVKKTKSRFEAELDYQNLNLDLLVAKFQYEVNAPW